MLGASSQLTVPQEICPGDSPVFSCTVNDPSRTGITFWTVTVDGTVDECRLVHAIANDMQTCGPGNEFQSSLGDPVGNLYPSTLTVDSIFTQLNGTIVECAGPSPSNVIGDTTICIVGEYCWVQLSCLYITITKWQITVDTPHHAEYGEPEIICTHAKMGRCTQIFWRTELSLCMCAHFFNQQYLAAFIVV